MMVAISIPFIIFLYICSREVHEGILGSGLYENLVFFKEKSKDDFEFYLFCWISQKKNNKKDCFYCKSMISFLQFIFYSKASVS